MCLVCGHDPSPIDGHWDGVWVAEGYKKALLLWLGVSQSRLIFCAPNGAVGFFSVGNTKNMASRHPSIRKKTVLANWKRRLITEMIKGRGTHQEIEVVYAEGVDDRMQLHHLDNSPYINV